MQIYLAILWTYLCISFTLILYKSYKDKPEITFEQIRKDNDDWKNEMRWYIKHIQSNLFSTKKDLHKDLSKRYFLVCYKRYSKTSEWFWSIQFVTDWLYINYNKSIEEIKEYNLKDANIVIINIIELSKEDYDELEK